VGPVPLVWLPRDGQVVAELPPRKGNTAPTNPATPAAAQAKTMMVDLQ
jgi:hypothetical protein